MGGDSKSVSAATIGPDDFDIRTCSLITLYWFDTNNHGSLTYKDFEELLKFVKTVQRKIKSRHRNKRSESNSSLPSYSLANAASGGGGGGAGGGAGGSGNNLRISPNSSSANLSPNSSFSNLSNLAEYSDNNNNNNAAGNHNHGNGSVLLSADSPLKRPHSPDSQQNWDPQESDAHECTKMFHSK